MDPSPEFQYYSIQSKYTNSIYDSVFGVFFSKARFRAHTMPYYIPTDRMYRRKIKHTLSHKHSNSSTFSTLKPKHTWNRIHKSKSVTTMCHFFFRLYFNCAIFLFSSMKIQNWKNFHEFSHLKFKFNQPFLPLILLFYKNITQSKIGRKKNTEKRGFILLRWNRDVCVF